MSVQQNNNNVLHTNLNCNISQDSKNSMYDIIVLKNTAKCTNNENVPIKICQKTAEIKIEDLHPYIAELVKILPNIGFLEKITGQLPLG